MMTRSTPVLTYRWIVFLLAAGYSIYHIGWGDYDIWGGPFRFLTFWGLFYSAFAGLMMLCFSMGITRDPWYSAAMVAAVVNTMVVFLYWRLYLIDPFLVHATGEPGAWWDNYYLHGLGPLLQIIDALFIARAFRKPLRAVLPLLVFILAFVSFGEVFVQNLADFPQGSVTSGLPYPFLNDMEMLGRAIYYAQNALIGLVLLGLYGALTWGAYRVLDSRPA